MQIAAQTKANHLMADILNYIKTNTPLDEMAKARYVKAAKEIPLPEQSQIVLALVYTASGEKQKAKQYCLQSLRNFGHSATFNNCIATLAINGYSKTLLDIASEFIDKLEHVVFVDAFESLIASLPSYEIFYSLLENLTKCKLCDQYRDMISRLSVMLKTMIYGNQELHIPLNTYGIVSDFVAQIIEQNGHLVLNQCRITVSHEGDSISVVYFVEKESEDILTADLNWDLAEKIIEAKLDTLPLVARFETVRANMIRVREAYAS
ncbi:hypothetical protein NMR51_003030 [Vibrio cholerae]|nr:hypothetical protein [Vibrio cholerae]